MEKVIGFRIVEVEDNDHPKFGRSQTFLIHGWMKKGGPLLQNWNANVPVKVFPSGKTFVEDITSTFTIVRPTEGILKGVKIVDIKALEASAARLAVSWLSKQLKRNLKPPAVPDTDIRVAVEGQIGDERVFFESEIPRSCTSCRWFRRVRDGGEEEGEFDFSDEDGLSLRDFDSNRSVEPRFQCLLSGVWLEDFFGISDELNEMSQSGMKDGRLINLRMDFDSWPTELFRRPNWHPDQEEEELNTEATRERLDPDDVAPPPQQLPVATDPTGEWASLEWLRNQLFRDRSCPLHRERSERREERIPAGWMPDFPDGSVLTVGGLRVRHV